MSKFGGSGRFVNKQQKLHKLILDVNSQSPTANELEVRFTSYDWESANDRNQARTQVDPTVYDIILSSYLTMQGNPTILDYEVQTFELDGKRYRIIDDGTGDIIKEVKTKLTERYNNEFGVKIVASSESESDWNEDIFQNNKEKLIVRQIHRTRFRKDGVYIDFSEIKGNRAKYEIELEIVNLKSPTVISDFVTMSDLVSEIYAAMNPSNIRYYEDVKVDLVTKFLRANGYNNLRNIPRPKELMWTHLTYDSLLKSNTYYVTTKIDGISALLVVYNKKLWLISYEGFNLLLDNFDLDENVIIYGELTSDKSFFFSEKLYPAQTTSYVNSFASSAYIDMTRSGSFLNMLTNIQVFFEKIDATLTSRYGTGQLYRFLTKDYTLVQDEYSFFIKMGEAIDKWKQVSSNLVPTDGLIFIPNVENYYQRLTGGFKWKPSDKLSMDLSVVWKKPNPLEPEKLYFGYHRNNDDPTPIIYDKTYDLKTLEQLLDKPLNPINLPSGKIVEFKYGEGVFVPLRIRNDKQIPNYEHRVLNIYKLMVNGIPESTLRGYDLRLMRKYHNRMKRSLFDSDNGHVLLDIGTGRGGDISKMSKYSKIIAVEPNADNLQELKSRLEGTSMKSKFSIIQGGVEDVDLILKEVKTVDTVSMMLSASFLWMQYDSMLRLLQELINRGLKRILLFTIDGYAVETYLNNPFYEWTNKSFSYKGYNSENLATINYLGDSRIHIDITEPSIVGSQTEGLVFVNDLITDINRHTSLSTRCVMRKFERADSELLLNEGERNLTKLYSAYTLDIVRYQLVTSQVTNVIGAVALARFPSAVMEANKLNLAKFERISGVDLNVLGMELGICIIKDGVYYNKAARFKVIINGDLMYGHKSGDKVSFLFEV